jgi:polyhydroxyalkanoate synthesis regulator phasin
VLTDELLALPAQVLRLTEQVAALSDAQRRTDVQLATLTEQVTALTRAVQVLTEDVGTLKGDVHILKTEVGTLKTDTGALRTDVGTLKDGVGELRGKSLENHYRAAGSPFFGALLRHPYVLSRGEVTDLLDEAVDRGVLAQDDAVEVQRADLIVRGTRRTDGVPVYLVVEVSWTVGTNDVESAARRAALLAKAGIVVMSVVAGEKIGEPARLLAPTRHVWQMTDDEIVPPTS